MKKGEFSIPIKLVILVTLLFIVATILVVSVLRPNLLSFGASANETASGAFQNIGDLVG